MDNGTGLNTAEDQDLRELKTSATVISVDVLKNNTLATFTVDMDWDKFLLGNHESGTLISQPILNVKNYWLFGLSC